MLVQRRIANSFLIAFGLLFLVTGLFFLSFFEMKKQNDWVSHTYEVISLLQSTLSGMKDIQSAQRGFLISGVQSYLDPYHAALKQVPQAIDALRGLIGDNQDQISKLDELEGHVIKRIDIARELIAIYEERGQAAAFSVVTSGTGKREMDYIREISAGMIDEESRLLSERQQAMNEHTRGTMGAGVAGLVICFGVLLMAFYQINREARMNAELQQALREQSIRDPLTNLFNRRYMEETIEREIARAHRTGGELAVLVADIDFFKKVNDTYGHEGGDAVLTAFADFVHTKVRQDDIACRMGGEEFVIILPGASLDKAVERANVICEGLRAMPVDFGDHKISVTTSVGVSVYPKHARDSRKLIAHADAALYQAKKNGRDQTVPYNETLSSEAA